MRAVARCAAIGLAASLACLAHAAHRTAAGAEAVILRRAGTEQVLYDDRNSRCNLREYPDSPARAVREADGTIVLFATFENNWFLTGPNWENLKPGCQSAGHGAQNPDPQAIDDKYWIQALHSLDGQTFIALGSHEYLGSRHPSRCRIVSTGTMAPPCWYSSITQYVSQGDARHFQSAANVKIVATPQVPFDAGGVKRIGYFTTSNIVSDGRFRYVLIFAEGSGAQPRGNCLFRAELRGEPTPWLGWDGKEFSADLSRLPQPSQAPQAVARCQPVAGLQHEARGLVRDKKSGTWIAVYSGRVGKQTGVVYSLSSDLMTWSEGQLLLDAPLTRRDPDCSAVYRYPSLIDHDADGFSFEEIGSAPFLYGVKILLENCRPVGRQITRIPLQISR